MHDEASAHSILPYCVRKHLAEERTRTARTVLIAEQPAQAVDIHRRDRQDHGKTPDSFPSPLSLTLVVVLPDFRVRGMIHHRSPPTLKPPPICGKYIMSDSHRLLPAQVFLLLLCLKMGKTIFCYQCDSMKDENCEESPPPPTNCTHCIEMDEDNKKCVQYKHYDFCMTVTKLVSGSKVSFTRACNPLPMADSCGNAYENRKPVRMCYTSCDTDGCNSAGPFRFSERLCYLVSVLVVGAALPATGR